MSRQHTILCVDDETNILRMVKRILEDSGHNVFIASSGMEAMKVLERENIDLILSDQRMPGMTGSELFCITKQKYPDAIRIMMSGYSDFESIVSAVNDGEIFRFISKPWDQEQFVELVRLALAQKDVVANIEDVIRSVCKVAKLVSKVTLESPPDPSCLVVRIGEESDILPRESVLRFLTMLFNTLGLEDKTASVAGAVTKDKGILSLTLDIGKGVLLKIKLPQIQ